MLAMPMRAMTTASATITFTIASTSSTMPSTRCTELVGGLDGCVRVLIGQPGDESVHVACDAPSAIEKASHSAVGVMPRVGEHARVEQVVLA